MSDIRKRITDFIDAADEKSLNRLISVIEHVESPVAGYTHTGEPVLMEELVNMAIQQKMDSPQG